MMVLYPSPGTMIKSIVLQYFRGYQKREFVFGKVNVVLGENGAGKSNLLEAIYLLATGKSLRADRDKEMIRQGDIVSVVDGRLENGDTLKVSITDVGKKFEVNGVARRMMDFVGKMPAVQFAPADMDLVSGSPGVRRRYLDFVIIQMDREYRRSLVSYDKGIRQRNRLLQLIREGTASRSQLYFWDRLVIKNGDYLTTKRAEFLAATGFDYDKSVISESRLKQYENEEVAAGTTLVGPHRDDFVFNRDGRDVSKYGSRGEQRMAVWWLKQCEIQYLVTELPSNQVTQYPLLLLDDIFSELDHKHREEVVELVKTYPGQVIMTSADEHMVPELDGPRWIRL